MKKSVSKQVEGKPVKDSLSPFSRAIVAPIGGTTKIPSNKRGQGTSD